jgi:transcriptional regulator with XRE-family HTH domain
LTAHIAAVYREYMGTVSVEAIGERVRAARLVKRMTQRELGHAIGLSEQAVNKYESGELRPSIRAFVGLCVALGCSADYLLGATDPIQVPGLPAEAP